MISFRPWLPLPERLKGDVCEDGLRGARPYAGPPRVRIPYGNHFGTDCAARSTAALNSAMVNRTMPLGACFEWPYSSACA
jgi:hypothetical protein